MALYQLLSFVLGLGLEQLVQWRYGAMGLACLLLIGIGVRARNSACLTTAAVLFVLLMTQA
ncbi:hypothetical protein FE633_27310 [Streptomyces montanus]|jgi:hypothetical protein|uniref:Uncharacterized protein n=1 Tax=Streptomyces montanus TaxID=2580423 RepID=A0A5R9FKH0_9ACTN|nr:hypothetical protein [Streptomyces montanus]TLS43059.1 hypothetical protein FE633_27310 [Streptomyces montanus]